MFRVRLINKIIGPSNGIFPVCGKSTKLYGHASYMPEHGGPVLDMSLEDYEKDKFDIIGNKVSGQQWVPQFYEVFVVSDEVLTGTSDDVSNGTFQHGLGSDSLTSDYTVIKPCPNTVNHAMGVTCQICNTTLTGDVTVIHSGRAKLLQFNELRKRAKAAGVWKQGMKLADVEEALSAVAD